VRRVRHGAEGAEGAEGAAVRVLGRGPGSGREDGVWRESLPHPDDRTVTAPRPGNAGVYRPRTRTLHHLVVGWHLKTGRCRFAA
jgi:hypothetical protein